MSWDSVLMLLISRVKRLIDDFFILLEILCLIFFVSNFNHYKVSSMNSLLNYSAWYDKSFKQNIKGLNIQDKLNKFRW